jgi:hypothetical protein
MSYVSPTTTSAGQGSTMRSSRMARLREVPADQQRCAQHRTNVGQHDVRASAYRNVGRAGAVAIIGRRVDPEHVL